LLLAVSIGSVAVAAEAERSTREILSELDAARIPAYDPSRRSEPGYIEKLQKDFVEIGAKRDVLILELFRVDPNHDGLSVLMAEHWRRMPPEGPNERKLKQEIADVLARTKNDKLRAEAYFARAQADLYKSQQTGILDLSGVDEFVRTYPKDPRAEYLLYMATFVARDEKARQALEDRLLDSYPKSRAAEAVLGTRRQRSSIGKPFQFEFTDAISGSTVSMKNLKGKVVVIDFWATWYGPCLAQVPHMRELYAKYHHHGLEFIGVSLDVPKENGGLENLKQFVKANGIAWPQYYQGKVWDGEFSKSWGINAIPAVFVVDTGGNLAAILGGEKIMDQLEQIIPDLLKKKGRGATTPAGSG
jgi:thiol-disulfide isomerase/thioredoxin